MKNWNKRLLTEFYLGDLIVGKFRDKTVVGYIVRIVDPKYKEYRIKWIDPTSNRHEFYEARTISAWIKSGVFSYYPVNQ